MPSSKRARFFTKHTPIHITVRCTLRYDLLVSPLYKHLLRELLAWWSDYCEVQVFAAAYLDNHFHLVLLQNIDDHDPEKIKGVAPFMRNVKQMLSHGFRLLEMSGCKFDGKYHATNIHTLEHLVDRLAYVHGQAERHRLARKGVQTTLQVFLDAKPDGVVTHLPDLFPEVTTLQERAQRLGRMLDHIIRQATAQARQRAKSQARLAAKQARVERHRSERIRAKQAINGIKRQRRDTPLDARPTHKDIRLATQEILRQHGIDPELPTNQLRTFEAGLLDPSQQAAALVLLRRPRLPAGIRIEHDRDERGLVVATHVMYGDSRTTIVWHRRIG